MIYSQKVIQVKNIEAVKFELTIADIQNNNHYFFTKAELSKNWHCLSYSPLNIILRMQSMYTVQHNAGLTEPTNMASRSQFFSSQAGYN